ncbi:Uncharacterised protein [uncultured archaeon]|nr:Uncharacterised protein [uncultured archaeon]
MRPEINRTALALVLLCLILASAFSLFVALERPSWPYSFDYSDAVVSNSGLGVLYKSFATYPYVMTYYPPLFYLIMDALNYAFPVSQPYFYERLITLAATLVDLALLYIVTRKVTKGGRALALIAPLLFASSYLIVKLGASCRPVMPELLFDLLAICLILESGEGKKRSGRVACSAAAMVVSLFFWQSSAILFCAMAAYLALNERLADAKLFVACYLAIAIPLIVAVSAFTGGRFFFSVFILPLITPLDLGALPWMLFVFLLESWLVPMLFFVLYYITRNAKSLISLATMSSVIYVASAAKLGASDNYFVVFLALCCVAAASGAQEFFGRAGAKAKTLAAACVMGSLLFMVSNVSYYGMAYPFHISNASSVGINLRNVTGQILVEDPAAAVAADKAVLFEPSMFWVMQQRGLWNDSQMASDIRAKRFATIAFPVGGGRFGYYPAIMAAINASYRINRTEFGWQVYAPS